MRPILKYYNPPVAFEWQILTTGPLTFEQNMMPEVEAVAVALVRLGHRRRLQFRHPVLFKSPSVGVCRSRATAFTSSILSCSKATDPTVAIGCSKAISNSLSSLICSYNRKTD
ncbi:unnamed protein product [Macrosiphum euphorbiae]|uniref:Uncharacterized protein n=1 Tax=Macrosiphum euphorbiae TaxID=13131 RepID=A0AAV0WC73_9HEMI|nr:unnamed protein product [Macrosiphum euphorbiae]